MSDRMKEKLSQIQTSRTHLQSLALGSTSKNTHCSEDGGKRAHEDCGERTNAFAKTS